MQSMPAKRLFNLQFCTTTKNISIWHGKFENEWMRNAANFDWIVRICGAFVCCIILCLRRKICPLKSPALQKCKPNSLLLAQLYNLNWICSRIGRRTHQTHDRMCNVDVAKAISMCLQFAVCTIYSYELCLMMIIFPAANVCAHSLTLRNYVHGVQCLSYLLFASFFFFSLI